MRLRLLAPLALLVCATSAGADYKAWRPNVAGGPRQAPPPLKYDAAAPALWVESFTIASRGYVVEGATLTARLRNLSKGTVRRVPWEIRDGRSAIARGVVEYINPTWVWVLQANWKPHPGRYDLSVVIDPGNTLHSAGSAASRTRTMKVEVKARPPQRPARPAQPSGPGSPGATRPGALCFGAAGGECQGPPAGTCEAPARGANGAHYGKCTINGGSWQHDTCCWAHPEGWFCSKDLGGTSACKALFDTAVARTAMGLNWTRVVNQDTRNATGSVVRSQYCALKGNYVHADDAGFCCSNHSRDLLPGEFHTGVAAGQRVKVCDGNDPPVGPDTP